jgi:hypothetical protein
MTEHRTPDRNFESGPRSFGVGSKIGDHHHQRCRPASTLDARQTGEVSQALLGKKLAFHLPECLQAAGPISQFSPKYFCRPHELPHLACAFAAEMKTKSRDRGFMSSFVCIVTLGLPALS